jgi:hypothetical protein
MFFCMLSALVAWELTLVCMCLWREGMLNLIMCDSWLRNSVETSRSQHSIGHDCHTNNVFRIALRELIELYKFRKAKLRRRCLGYLNSKQDCRRMTDDKSATGSAVSSTTLPADHYIHTSQICSLSYDVQNFSSQFSKKSYAKLSCHIFHSNQSFLW